MTKYRIREFGSLPRCFEIEVKAEDGVWEPYPFSPTFETLDRAKEWLVIQQVPPPPTIYHPYP